jgi:DNA gyrase inhibitor GyrI
MKSGLVYLRPARMTYIRVTGPYEKSIPEAWARMLEWVDRHGLSSPIGRGYGLARDNPERVGAQHCRYDACVMVTPLFEERASRELGLITLPAGPYARLRRAGGYDQIPSVVAGLHTGFESPPDLRLDDRRPIVTIYLEDPRRFDPVDLRADVCVPVSAAGAIRDSVQAAA